MKKEPAMVTLIEDYLVARRAMGFELRIAGGQLLAFARFADQIGHRGPLTTALMARWAQSANRSTALTASRRLEVLRPFAKHRLQFDHGTEILPRTFFGPAHRRLVPHIYTEHEIVSLLNEADSLSSISDLHPLTYRTLLGLLAVTGLRISEALHLKAEDVELSRGLLIVRQTKFRKSRFVPLHETAVAALTRYVEVRCQKLGNHRVENFFVSKDGKALTSNTVHWTFRRLRANLGLVARGGHAAPRIHDLRHSFICHVLLRSYRQNQPVDSIVDALSTYVGHGKVSDTYWYITGIPELMALAAQRFEQFANGGER